MRAGITVLEPKGKYHNHISHRVKKPLTLNEQAVIHTLYMMTPLTKHDTSLSGRNLLFNLKLSVASFPIYLLQINNT